MSILAYLARSSCSVCSIHFFHLSQIAERPMLSKSLSLRANQSHYKGKVETDVKPSVIVELDALDEPESKDAAELGTL